MVMAVGFVGVMALLVGATALTLRGLRDELARRKRYTELRRVLANSLARDHIVHDRGVRPELANAQTTEHALRDLIDALGRVPIDWAAWTQEVDDAIDDAETLLERIAHDREAYELPIAPI